MTVIILLILTGMLLLILELFVFPGVSVAGVGGFIAIGVAVYLGYSNYGVTVGSAILIASIIVFVILVIIALRSKTWKRFSLDAAITGQVATVDEQAVKAGDHGITITRLNPVGKARINEVEMEAHCPAKFIDPKTEIEVVKVFKTHVIVKPLN
ncbi:MAG: hypothetical protein LBV41_01555 [Cytophagaceae bacterium]|jgi:membrane-bound ClpP family serine protease|nr:hypothetical protein [Cytophagaceae bacterium]